MTHSEHWLDGSNAYLEASIAWIHARLRRLAHASMSSLAPENAAGTGMVPVDLSMTDATRVVDASAAADSRPWYARMFGAGDAGARTSGRSEGTAIVAADPRRTAGMTFVADGDGNVSISFDEQVANAYARRQAASGGEPPPTPLLLQRVLGLTDFELDTLLLCAAMELDTRTGELCAQAQGGHRNYPTFALSLALFDGPAWEVLSAERPLRYWRLIEITQPEAQPLMTSALRIDERMLHYLKGLNAQDDRLSPYVAPLPHANTRNDLSQSQAGQVDEIVTHVRAHRDAKRAGWPLVELVGPAAASKPRIAAAAAGALGLNVYRASLTSLPRQAAELNNWVRLWEREVKLAPVALLLDGDEAESRVEDEHAAPAALRRLIGREALVFLCCREAQPRLNVDATIVEVRKPTSVEQAQVWSATLDLPARDASRLAGQFSLDLEEIRRIAHTHRAMGATDPSDLWRACLRTNRPSLDLLAHRIDARATWADIVLPDATERLLREIARQVEHRGDVYDEWGFRNKRSRGLGISVLFVGESGTGKTMAAEVLANELQLDVYRIDLSAVVSKYIGETEKNLRRVFDAADDGGAILLFDEADALFGKRSEVKDSHDRYANIEINYLLQRMESYNGLAILATNMKSALDTAFLRRLRFIVNFTVPGAAERKRIWTQVFPDETPVETDDAAERLDYERLAKIVLPGGSIENAALNAAFLARAADGRVTMPVMARAIETELKKMEQTVRAL